MNDCKFWGYVMATESENYDILSLVKHFNEIRPFNKLLGLTIDSMDIENACVRFAMKEDLSGNSVYDTLHGGVVSAILDITGGFVVFLDLFKALYYGKKIVLYLRRLLFELAGDGVCKSPSRFGDV